jgi:DNA-binding CsgD family transcriptional regulator
VHDTLQQVEDQLTIEQMVARSNLTERQNAVLRLRFGLDEPALTLREISEQIGKSYERVRQIEARALKKIRAHNGMREYGREPYSPPIQRDPLPPPVEPWLRDVFAPQLNLHPQGFVRVTCDRCPAQIVCGAWHDGGALPQGKVAGARSHASRKGWLIGGQDLCPACANLATNSAVSAICAELGKIAHAEQVPGPAPIDAGGGP